MLSRYIIIEKDNKILLFQNELCHHLKTEFYSTGLQRSLKSSLMVYKGFQGAYLPWVPWEKSTLLPLKIFCFTPHLDSKRQMLGPSFTRIPQIFGYFKSKRFKMWSGATISAHILWAIGFKAPTLCRVLMIKSVILDM